MALLSGAALVLIEEPAITDVPAFARYLEERNITAVTMTPRYLAALERHPLPTVRTLITAGDIADPATTLFYAGTKRVFNAYGPTEVSVCASMHRVDLEPDSYGPIPIGMPVANSSIEIVDRFGNLLPWGMRGEIVVEGPGVARGYMRPAASSPFTEGAQRRYRTGDIGRWLPGGSLAFHGRIDRQVKVRGYRVEPSEVENALLRHPSVKAAHVAAEGDLLAYVSTRQSIELWPSIAEFFVYDDIVYGAMARDEKRNRSYRAALERKVRGKVVLEIGPGSEAVLTRMCLDAGACKVYAIEISPDTAARARAKLQSLGLADRAEVIHADIVDVTLPELADCCVSEIVGSIGGSEGAAMLINSARRLMKDPRCQTPARGVTRIAGIGFDGHRLDLHFSEVAARYVERIFRQAGAAFDLRLCLKNLPGECILTTGDVFEDLDFREPVPMEGSHPIRLRVTRDGRLDGFLVWLRLTMDADYPAEAIDILESKGSWLPVYFPLAAPIAAIEGDEVQASVVRRLASNRRNPEYLLDGWLVRDGRRVTPITYNAFHVAPCFRGTPFYEKLFADGSIPVMPEASAAGLRKFLAGQLPHYMAPAHFEFLDRIPINANGKVDRTALPSPHATNSETRRTEPRNEMEAQILEVWEDVLGRSPLGVEDNFFAVGGDSIRAIQIASRLADGGIRISAAELLESATVRALAHRAHRSERKCAQETVGGPLPLTAIQSWFFSRFTEDPHHFNQAVLLRFAGRLDAAGIGAVFDRITGHHDGLRSRFEREPDGIHATIEPAAAACDVDVIDLRGVSGAAARLEAAAGELHANLNLERGPLVRAAIFRMDDCDRLLWIVHHLVVDWVSWRILIEDLQSGYRQWLGRSPVRFSAKTDSFQEWARQAHLYAASEALAAQCDYWERAVAAEVSPLLRDFAAGEDRVGDARTVACQLPSDATALLLADANRAYNTEPGDLLLTALAHAVERVRGPGKTLVMLEGHGREPLSGLDVSRTVGWFTSVYPVVLDSGRDPHPGARIKTVKEYLRAVPNKGVGFGILSCLSSRSARSSAFARETHQIGFNYLGQFGPPGAEAQWEVASECSGAPAAARAIRPCELEFLASCAGGCLHLSLTYAGLRYRRNSAERLLAEFKAELLRLGKHCASRQHTEPTLSDMSYSQLSEREFEDLFALQADGPL
jgi:non-ribosomal peptide synthase protein (TIGR01720 family)